jgi:hypothetical protein
MIKEIGVISPLAVDVPDQTTTALPSLWRLESSSGRCINISLDGSAVNNNFVLESVPCSNFFIKMKNVVLNDILITIDINFKKIND